MLTFLALRSPQRVATIVAAGGVEPMVQRLRGGHAVLRSVGLLALVNMTCSAARDAASAAMAEAGAIPAAIELLGSDDAQTAQHAAGLLLCLASDSPRWL